MRNLFFFLLLITFVGQLIAQDKAVVSNTATLDTLPDWYWNSKMQAHGILLPNFFNCGLHHYDGNSEDGDNCPAGVNCNDCFLKGIYTDYFKAINARIVRRTIKGSADNPTWCTSVGEIYNGLDPISGAKNGLNIKDRINQGEPCEDLNIPRQLMLAAHDIGIKQVFYYRTSADKYFSEQFPNWKAKSSIGKDIPFAGSKYSYLCVNTPYSNALNERVKELIRFGTDALYFDNYHNPNTGCWCTSCQEKFPLEMGQPLPANANSPIMVDYYNKIIYKHINSIQNTIHNTQNGNPYPSFLIGSVARFTMMNKRDVNKKFVQLLDVPKSEYTHPLRLIANKYFYINIKGNELINYRIPNSTRLGFAWTALRDYASHRTFSAWIEPEMRYFPEIDKFKTVPIPKDQLMSYLGAAYAFGFVIDPALYVNSTADVAQDSNLIKGGVPNSETLANYKAVFDVDSLIGPKIGSKKPIKWNAILFDADLKDDYLKNIETAPGVSFRDEVADQNSLWKSYLLQCHAAFEAIKNYKNYAGVNPWSVKQPVYVLDHDDFLNMKNLEGITNIIVPNRAVLSDAILSALETFNAQDSKHVYFLEPGAYYNKSNTSLEQQTLLQPLYLNTMSSKKSKPPIYARAKGEEANNVFVEFYEGASADTNSKYDFIVALTNNISWSVPVATRRVYAINKTLDFTDSPDQIENLELNPPNPIESNSITIRIQANICSGLINTHGEIIEDNLQVFDLISGSQLNHLVAYSDQEGEFIIKVPSFEFIAALGIRIDGDCAPYAGWRE